MAALLGKAGERNLTRLHEAHSPPALLVQPCFYLLVIYRYYLFVGPRDTESDIRAGSSDD